MGYYVSMRDSNFSIPESDEVLQVLKDANWKYQNYKNGGSFGRGESTRWFSWMPSDYDQVVTSVAEVFELLGFEVDKTLTHCTLMNYDSKIGQEDLFLALVAPFVEEGSWIEWQGEDGASWRHEVVNGRLHVRDAYIQYGDPKPYLMAVCEYIGDVSQREMKFVLCDPYSDKSPAEQWDEQVASVKA